jgi:hypothetical protein
VRALEAAGYEALIDSDQPPQLGPSWFTVNASWIPSAFESRE